MGQGTFGALSDGYFPHSDQLYKQKGNVRIKYLRQEVLTSREFHEINVAVISYVPFGPNPTNLFGLAAQSLLWVCTSRAGSAETMCLMLSNPSFRKHPRSSLSNLFLEKVRALTLRNTS